MEAEASGRVDADADRGPVVRLRDGAHLGGDRRVGQTADPSQRVHDDAPLQRTLRVDCGMHQITPATALVPVRAGGPHPVGRRHEHGDHTTPDHVLALLCDVDLDSVAGQRSVDQGHSAIGQPAQAEAAGDEGRDVHLEAAHTSTVASSTVRAATDIRIPLPSGGDLRGAVALPEDPGPHPGCIVVSDALGLSDDMRRICARLADEGYAAIAPDLYSHGAKPLCVARVLTDLVSGAHGRTLDDIEAAREHLVNLPGVDGERLVAIGFCMGGGFALSYAAQRGGLRAASVNYGSVPKGAAALTTVCPIVGSYGGDDKLFLSHARRLERHLDELAIDHDVKIYDGVGHSFMNDLSRSAPRWLTRLPNPMAEGYDETAAEDAWTRILAFFADHLR